MKSKYFYHKRCPFCHASERRVVYKIDEQNLVECVACKLKFLDKQRIDFENLYNEDYYFTKKDNNSANYSNYQIHEKVVKRNFAFAYQYIGDHLSQTPNLLEVGGGFGYFAKFLPPKVHYEANEVSIEAVKYMKKEKIVAYQGDFLKISFKKKYDFIVAFDVIEHQVDLKKYLEKTLKVLSKDGVFIFTTPDFSSLPNTILGKNAPTIQPAYHNYYFDKQWLQKALPSMGFEVITLRTIYTNFLSIGQILLLTSFALPNLKNSFSLIKKLGIGDTIIPFIRMGGIECIVRKR